MELLKKMKRKEEKEMVIINAPASFQETEETLRSILSVRNDLSEGKAEFILVFFENAETIRSLVPQILESITDDALLWAAYPKKSSKKIRSDISRDNGWEIFGEFDYEPVGQISIDEDWSALRFRPLKNISSFSRSEKMILSEEGRKRSEMENRKKRKD